MVNITPSSKSKLRSFIPPWFSGGWGIVGIAFIAYLLVFISWTYFHWGGAERITLIGNLAILPPMLLATLTAWRVTSQSNLDRRLRLVWFILGLSFFMNFIGNVIWTYLENGLHVEPFPSSADAFYLAFYPLMLWGILSLPSFAQNRRERLILWLDLLSVITMAGMFVTYFIIVPTAAANNSDLLTQSIAVAYPIGSLLLISGMMAILFRRPSPDTHTVLIFLLIGMAFYITSDLGFGYESLADTYMVGSWVDAGWGIAQLFFMLAALRQIKSAPVPATKPGESRKLDTLAKMLPLLAVVLSYGLVLYVIAINFSSAARWLLIGSVLLTMLLIARQFLAPSFINVSVRIKLILTFLLVSLFSLGLVTFFTYLNLRSNVELAVGAHLKTQAEIQAQALVNWVGKQSDVLEGYVMVDALKEPVIAANAQYSGSSAVIQAQLRQQDWMWKAASDSDPLVQNVLSNDTARQLHQFLDNFPEFTDVLITDKYGALIAATSRPAQYVHANEEWWQATSAQGQGVIYIGQPVFAPKRANTKIMIIAMPIRSSSGDQLVGIIRAFYDTQGIVDLLAASNRDMHGDLLLPGGRLLTSNGDVVPLDSNTVARLSETADADYTSMSLAGMLQLVSQAPVISPDPEEVAAFEKLDWTLVVHQDPEVALAPVNAAWQTASLIIVIVLIVTGGVAVFLAQLFVAPISRLTAVAGQITAGNFSAKAAVESRDEIGMLASTFNSMLDTLSHAQQELWESEALYRSLVDYSPDMIEVHRNGKCLLINPAGVNLLGAKSADELVGQQVLDILHWKDREHVRLGIENVQATREPTPLIQQTMHRLDGSSFEAEFRAIPILYAGEPAIQLVLRDITERKMAEEQIHLLLAEVESQKGDLELRVAERTEELNTLNQRLQKELIERQQLMLSLSDSEERFRLLFEASPDAILLIDPNLAWPIVDCNEAACMMNGYTREELIGQSVDVLNASPAIPGEREAYLEFLRHQGVLHRDAFHRHKDGHVFPIEVSSSLISFAGRELVLGIDRDVTQRKQIEVAMNQAKDAAEESRRVAEAANRAKSEFLSRMSHELRTPMNAILGFAQLLDMGRKEPLTSMQKERVKQIVKGGQHLLNLINEILDISRIEANRLQISPEPVSVRESIQEALDLTVPLAVKRHIQVVTKLGSMDVNPFVMADRQRFKQVLLNLLGNAVKYNYDEGSVIITWQQTPSNRWRISITDTGPGISQANLARLFIPFERLGADQPNVEGTGLGLVLAKRLVELMKGQIGVESMLGRGSTFWVELPATESPVERLERTGGTGALPVMSAAARTILYVEDNVANFELIQQVLTEYSQVELLWATELKAGIELARQRRPNLILLDLHLGGSDGTEVLQQLKQDVRTTGIPVVVVSADATHGQAERLTALGAHAYLTKPLNVKQFVRLVEELLGEKEF